jgi:hypothetical protein
MKQLSGKSIFQLTLLALKKLSWSNRNVIVESSIVETPQFPWLQNGSGMLLLRPINTPLNQI